VTWAIVLGGSSGLGLASAKKLAEEGYKLCLVYREPRARGDAVAASMRELEGVAPALLHFNADALTEAGRNAVLDELERHLTSDERVHVLLHSLAKGALKPLSIAPIPAKIWPTSEPTSHRDVSSDTPTFGAELASRDVHLTIEAMGVSLLDWVLALRSRQLFGSDARVLAFTSEGTQRAWRGYGAVAAAKACLESLVRTIAYELGPFGIRANCIQAGVTDTPALRMIPGNESLRQHAVLRNPLGRLTTPKDVANAVVLLCKPEAAWINGTTLVVDGGEHLC
jgi:enoyl-[acyl-carrier protein] reductase III